MEAAGQSFDNAFAEEIDINELQFHEVPEFLFFSVLFVCSLL